MNTDLSDRRREERKQLILCSSAAEEIRCSQPLDQVVRRERIHEGKTEVREWSIETSLENGRLFFGRQRGERPPDVWTRPGMVVL
jgi:hypothetical protein